MPRRSILTDRQRAALFDLPTDEASMLRHYTLADDDLEIIHARRRPHNRFGFALQLCALRYPRRLLAPGEVIPLPVTRFLAAQLAIRPDDLAGYAAREETRHEHLAILRDIYGYKMFAGRGARDLKIWLEDAAETARSNEDLARRFVVQCRATRTILPGVTTIERLCADALVAAERRIVSRIAEQLDDAMRTRLDALLTEDAGGSVTRFVWLRQFEAGQNWTKSSARCSSRRSPPVTAPGYTSRPPAAFAPFANANAMITRTNFFGQRLRGRLMPGARHSEGDLHNDRRHAACHGMAQWGQGLFPVLGC